MPHYFYTYNISSDDFAVIETTRAEIYLFTMGTPYKINSRTLVLASSGEGFYHSNIPPRSHSAVTLNLGYRFLWIDRYCINQSDNTEAQSQIKQMGFIYQESDLTIIATARTGPSYGLPDVSKSHLKLQPVVRTNEHLISQLLYRISAVPWRSLVGLRADGHIKQRYSPRGVLYLPTNKYTLIVMV
jgi:hypothetical protein